MFNDNIFEKWLDEKSQELVNKIGAGEPLSGEEMIILVLKAQSNHFYHLDKDLRDDMKELREDTARQIMELREDTARQIIELREDMDKRFEQVDKRFEQVDKRFEEMGDRLDDMLNYLWMISTAFLGLTGISIGFAMWDRKTSIKAAKEDIIEDIKTNKLKEFVFELQKLSKEDKELAKVLKSFHLI